MSKPWRPRAQKRSSPDVKPRTLLTLLALGAVGVWLWRRYGAMAGNGAGPALQVAGNVGATIKEEDSSGQAVAALAPLLASGTTPGNLSLSTPKLSLEVENPEGIATSMIVNHCTTDPGDGICQDPAWATFIARFRRV